MRVAVIGAGWAGMAAAIAHSQAGHEVTVFEAARTVGGRARTVAATLPDGRVIDIDNGQHILIGAYAESLRLMRLVGVDPDTALLRVPLTLRFPDGHGVQLPDLSPPLDALLGIATARGWRLADKLALLRTAALWQWRGFVCAPATTVAQLCAGLSERLMADFIEPLCVSALNTPARDASGQVFLRVLQDSLFSGRGGSHLLLPRRSMGALFPQAAVHWLQARGTAVRTGQRVQRLVLAPDGQQWQVHCGPGVSNAPPGDATHLGTTSTATGSASHASGAARRDLHEPTSARDPAPTAQPALQGFDHVTLACPPWEASRLVAHAQGLGTQAQRAAQAWSATASALRFEAITTVYAHANGVRLPRPMLALRNTPEHPAQFVLDRGQLDEHHGLLAFVISTSVGAREQIELAVQRQAAEQLALPAVQPVLTVVEKRATFACTPGLVRPAARVLPMVQSLSACGDYVEGPYPATLEGAVLSGSAVSALATTG